MSHFFSSLFFSFSLMLYPTSICFSFQYISVCLLCFFFFCCWNPTAMNKFPRNFLPSCFSFFFLFIFTKRNISIRCFYFRVCSSSPPFPRSVWKFDTCVVSFSAADCVQCVGKRERWRFSEWISAFFYWIICFNRLFFFSFSLTLCSVSVFLFRFVFFLSRKTKLYPSEFVFSPLLLSMFLFAKPQQQPCPTDNIHPAATNFRMHQRKKEKVTDERGIDHR